MQADDLSAKRLPDFLQRRLAGFDDLTGDGVGINDRDAGLLKKTGRSGLAHPDTASESESYHVLGASRSDAVRAAVSYWVIAR